MGFNSAFISNFLSSALTICQKEAPAPQKNEIIGYTDSKTYSPAIIKAVFDIWIQNVDKVIEYLQQVFDTSTHLGIKAHSA